MRSSLITLVLLFQSLQKTHQQHQPKLMYGTAWKKGNTTTETLAALNMGYTAIDTANQPKHYNEAGVGEAVKEYLEQHPEKTRDDLFIQSKYSFPNHQDANSIPYNSDQPIKDQVMESFRLSLAHLNTTYLDSYIIHGPKDGGNTFAPEDWEAWRAFESLYDSGKVRFIGWSNINVHQLKVLVEKARITPHFVQNRLIAKSQWSREERLFCASHSITFQAFGAISVNRYLQHLPFVKEKANEFRMSPGLFINRLVMNLGGTLLITGTSNQEHLSDNLALVNQTPLPKRTISSIVSLPPPDIDQDPSEALTVKFRNANSFAIDIFWVSHDRKLVPQGTLKPHDGSREIRTYSTHKFVLKNMDVGKVFSWQARASKGRVQNVDVTFEKDEL